MKKILLIALAVVIGLIGLAVVSIGLWFDPNDYRGDAEAAFQRATGRELHLTGRLSVSLLPWLAVETGAASIANRPGFGTAPFASIREARIGVRLWPLLAQHRVEVGRVSVEGLQLNLQVDATGANNSSDMLEQLGRREAPPKEPRAAGRPFEFSIASLELEDSRVAFDDHQANSHYLVEHWDIETGRLAKGVPVDARTGLHVTRNGRPIGRFDLGVQIDITEPGTAQLRHIDGRMQLAGIGPRAEGLPIEVRAPRIAMDDATRNLQLDELEARLPGLTVRTTLQVVQGEHGPTVTGPLQVREGQPRQLFEALGIGGLRPRDAEALSQVEGSTRLEYAATSGLRLGALDFTLDGARLQGEISIPDLARRQLRFDLRCDRANVDRYLPPPAAPGIAPASAPPPQGPEVAQARERSLAALRRLDVEGSLALGQLIAGGVTYQDVQSRFTAHDGLLVADPVEARAFGGRTTTRVRVDVRGSRPAVRLQENFADVDVGQMLGQLIGVRQLQGRGRAAIDLTLGGFEVREMMRGANGTFDLTVENGTLIGADLWHEIEKGLASAQGKSAPAGNGTGRTPFQRLYGRGTLGQQTLRNERLEFASDFLKVHGDGTVDFGHNRLDLDLTARLLKLPPGRVLGIKVSRIEGAKIPVRVGGRIDQPQVQPDVTALLGAVAKSVVTEPLGGSVKKKLRKLLPR